jgi:hypothetical protein
VSKRRQGLIGMLRIAVKPSLALWKNLPNFRAPPQAHQSQPADLACDVPHPRNVECTLASMPL